MEARLERGEDPHPSKESSNDPVFEKASVPPPAVSSFFLPKWSDVDEHTGIAPLFVSTFEGYERGRDEFLRGAALLGLGTPDNPKRKSLLPQQFVIADVLQAQHENGTPIHVVNALLIPRRASKTTSVWAVALGRISNPERGEYNVGFTAQTAQKARARFLTDVAGPLERQFPDPATAPFTIKRGSADTHLVWKETGNRIQILTPAGEAFRGEAYGMAIIDEAQTIEPGDASIDLLQGILPTFDTITIDGQTAAQLVLTGTAPGFQGGLFNEQLQLGRDGKAGIVEYGAPADTPDFDEEFHSGIEGTTADPEVWQRAHPGIGNLTPLSAVQRNFDAMTLAAFKQEYLSMTPAAGGVGFLDSDKWNKARIPGDLPQPPTRFTIGVAVHQEAKCASVVAVWRDENGLAHISLLAHEKGTKWVTNAVHTLATKYRRSPVVYDSASVSGHVELDPLSLMTPRVKPVTQSTQEIAVGAQLFVKELEHLRIRHYDQPPMNDAAAIVKKRQFRDSPRWSFGRPNPGDDITPIEAAALALRYHDATPEKPKGGAYFG